MDAPELCAFLRSRAEDDLLPLEAQLEAVRRSGRSFAEVEGVALESGLLPLRYRRNRQTLSTEDQLRLFRSRVVVVGCGGLGGYVIEEAARAGVGTLVLVDPDVFEEHNLNRQLLSCFDTLGRPKVDAGRERVARLNPAVTVSTHHTALSGENGREILAGSSAVVDALDNLTTRRTLAGLCRALEIPLVHGAIAGWYGQVTVQLPGRDMSGVLGTGQGKGVEQRLGNPSFTPATIASLQVAELVKVLLGRATSLAGQLLLVNLLDMDFQRLGYE